jgi:hypothetical protein
MEPQARLSHLIDWNKSNGGWIHPDVAVVHGDLQGLHVKARADKTIAALTIVASCPMETTLSILNAMDIAPFRSHGTNFPTAFIQAQTPTIVNRFFLMEQYLLSESSWWTPYISTLPSPENFAATYFTKDDLHLLDGTNVGAALIKRTQEWMTMYSGAMTQLKTLRWPSAMNSKYTWFDSISAHPFSSLTQIV